MIPEPFDYEAPWWQKLSRRYRAEKGWRCEECGLSFSDDTKYLHTHHIKGTRHNKPEDLKALCIGCHSEHHQNLKKKPEYKDFMTEYGRKWKAKKNHA